MLVVERHKINRFQSGGSGGKFLVREIRWWAAMKLNIMLWGLRGVVQRCGREETHGKQYARSGKECSMAARRMVGSGK